MIYRDFNLIQIAQVVSTEIDVLTSIQAARSIYSESNRKRVAAKK